MKLQTTNTRGKPEVCVLLSGGIDSTACVAFYLDVGRRPCAVFVDYQQPAAQREAIAAQEIADYYGVALAKLNWVGRMTKTHGLIPARNAFLLMAALMERLPTVTTIAMGIHAGTDYKDCSPEFIEQMQSLFSVYSDGDVSIGVPFIDWTKADIWAFCQSRDVPVELTWSCERSVDQPCGQCLSCLDREAAHAFT